MVLFILACTPQVLASTITVSPGQSIQDAINGANYGDTVYVESGTYNENVVVNQSISLIGNGMPVVSVTNGNGISIESDDVTLQGFSISTSSAYGIYVTSGNNHITGNTVSNSYDGIFLYDSDYNTVMGNIVNNCTIGIAVDGSSYNNVQGNIIDKANTGIGILINSYYNTIAGNTANNGSIGFSIFKYCDYNTLIGNTAENNTIGIDLFYVCSGNSITGNTVNNSNAGIYLNDVSDNTVVGNTANNNYAGIEVLSASNFNNVSRNTFKNNSYAGLYLSGAHNNSMAGNNATGNSYGIYLENSAGNVFWLNSFHDNTNGSANVTDGRQNYWNSTAPLQYTFKGQSYTNYAGNYWGDYSGPDAEGDGIGDTPYMAGANNIDYYPMLLKPPMTAVPETSGWTFRSYLNHTGVYDNGGIYPANSLVWAYKTGDWVVSSPTVANGTVYVGSNDGKVYALNATSGMVNWSYTTQNRVQSSPAVANGTVFVGSYDYNVSALDAITGMPKWTHMTDGSIYSSPAIAYGNVYVGSIIGTHGKVYALDANTGAEAWNYITGSVIHSSPAVANGMVYVGCYDGKVYALDAITGQLSWTYATGSMVYSSPAVANGTVYVGSCDNSVYALDAATGALKWSHATGGSVYSSPAVANGLVYVGSYDGKVYALDANTGAEVWNYATGGWVYSSPAVANGTVYIGSSDRKVYALDATTGTLKWAYWTGDIVESSPSVASGIVYVGSHDNKVYAIGSVAASTGEVKNLRNGKTFTAIQAAIDDGNTLAGDTLQVSSGTYKEHIVINKAITLTGVDTGNGIPVIDALGSGNDAITITTSNATVRGFNTTNDGWGITISSYGHQYWNNVIADNVLSGSYGGIDLSYSNNNFMSNNTVAGPVNTAISLYFSNNNTLAGNIVQGGIYNGISISASNNNTVVSNTVTNNNKGISLSGTGNVFWLNTIARNTVNASLDMSANRWNSTIPLVYTYNGHTYTNYTGNYWGDYNGHDANNDGIGDVPYVAGTNNVDYYPMVPSSSNTNASFTINLAKGWNLVSFPVGNYSFNASDLEALLPGDQAIYKFDAASQKYAGYDEQLSVSGDFAMVPDAGYLILSSANASFTVTGPVLQNRSTPLVTGWNLVGWSTFDAVNASDLEASLTGNQAVYGFATTSQKYYGYDEQLSVSGDFSMQPGEGYFIQSNTATTLNYG